MSNFEEFLASSDEGAKLIRTEIESLPELFRRRAIILVNLGFSCGLVLGGDQMGKILNSSLTKTGAA